MAKREPADVSRRRILDAAARRFGDFGFEATRVEDVASDVGIGRSGVLYHFESKQGLYDAVMVDLYAELLEEQRAILRAPIPLVDKMERFVSGLIDAAVARPAVAKISLRGALSADPEDEKETRARSRPFVDLFAEAVEAFSGSEGAAPTLDYRIFGSTIIGSILYYVAALPTVLGPQRDDLMAPERIEALKRAMVRNAIRTLEDS